MFDKVGMVGGGRDGGSDGDDDERFGISKLSLDKTCRRRDA